MPGVRAMGWRLANRFGNTTLRAWSLNDQYRRGHWEALAAGRRSEVVELVERLADGGFVVELGCGEGHLIRTVDPASYDRYLGLDISEVAIEAARRDPPPRCRFEVQDLSTWVGTNGADLIISEESLYYLRPATRELLLQRCGRSITPDGAVLVTFSDGAEHAAVIDQCCRLFPRHSIIDGPGPSIFLVLRPDRRRSPRN